VNRIPFQRIDRVLADGAPLGLTQYCFNAESGWISLAQAPAAELVVEYVYSTRLDLVALNWDDTIGNYLFLSDAAPTLYAVKGQTGTELKLIWTGGDPLFDVLESPAKDFGPGLRLAAESLDLREWSDLPGTIGQGGLLFYRIY
jgi:hypothetical protein